MPFLPPNQQRQSSEAPLKLRPYGAIQICLLLLLLLFTTHLSVNLLVKEFFKLVIWRSYKKTG